MVYLLTVMPLLIQICLVSIDASTFLGASVTVNSMFATHDDQLSTIVSDIKTRSPGRKITLKRRPEQSHCPRPHAYKSTAVQLDISNFDKLLNIEYLSENDELINLIPSDLRSRVNENEIVAVADVQALMSMEQLVDALLPLGLMPAIVPEFKGITVGGSLQGLAAESSSYKYGFVHDAIIGFEAVLTDGSVLWCSADSNSDLFYSLPGSFGSLAICTRLQILCIKAEPYVTVVCTQHNNQSDCVDFMSEIQNSEIENERDIKISGVSGIKSPGSVDFLEGIAFKKNQVVSVTAKFKSKNIFDVEIENSKKNNGKNSNNEKNIENGKNGNIFIDNKLHFCNGWGNKWFFNQVRDSVNRAVKLKKRSKRNKSGISNSSKNIIDNIDNTLNNNLNSDLNDDIKNDINSHQNNNLNTNLNNNMNNNLNNNLNLNKNLNDDLIISQFTLPLKDYLFRHDQGSFWMASYRIPQIIGKFMGQILDSTNMFKLATALPWAFPKNTIVLQDFILPRNNVKEFFNSMEEQLDVWPVWLLPMRNIPQERSLFASPNNLDGQHLCNVGAYGIPNKKYNFIQDNIKLEELLFQHNGRKVYYSHAFYVKDFFYNKLYDGIKYFQLRNKYCADEALPEIFDKIITKDGKL